MREKANFSSKHTLKQLYGSVTCTAHFKHFQQARDGFLFFFFFLMAITAKGTCMQSNNQ